MKQNCLFLVILIFGITSCGVDRTQPPTTAPGEPAIPVVLSNINEPKLASATPTITPTKTPEPSATRTPTITPPPSRTPTQTPLPYANAAKISVDEQRALMGMVIASGKWEQLELPEPINSDWQRFAEEQGALGANETDLMFSFFAQWGMLNDLVEKSPIKSKSRIQFKSLITADNENVNHIAVYLIDKDTDVPQYFLIVRDGHSKPVGILPAPQLTDLDAQVSMDGGYIDYYDSEGRLMLLADARKLDVNDLKEKKLRDRLEHLYPYNKYFAYASYPRFFLPVEGIKAGFYGLEETLTAAQILQLNEAFLLFNRPELLALRNAFFGSGVSVIIINDLGRAVGLTYTGTGVVEIDRQDLFGNKYWITMVLAHEASHVLQGALPDAAMSCAEIEKREIGDHKIPVDFYGWSADELITAVKSLRIGAYHVSLWIMNKLGIKNLKPFQDAIYTGKVNGQSVVIDCRFSGHQ